MTAAARPAIFWRLLPAVAVATLVWPLVDSATGIGIGKAAPVLAPLEVPGWQHAGRDDVPFIPQYKEASASLHETLRRDDAVIGLYVAYYRDQDARRKLVSSENVLVRSEDSTWRATDTTTRRESIAGAPHTIVATQLLGPGGQALTVWQWYWIDGTITSSDAYAKALTAWSRLRGRGDDSAAVIVYAPGTDSGRATGTLQAFTRDAWPAIAGVLARTAQAK